MIISKKMNVFEKINAIEEQIKLELPYLDLNKLAYIFGRISHYLSGQGSGVLSETERALCDFMIRNQLNDKTMYRWFLLKNAPSELKVKIINGMRLKDASHELSLYNRARENPNDTSIINDIQKYVRRYVNG